MTAERGRVQSVDRALRILRALAAGTSRLGVTELSERLGMAKGTVHGLLRTLERLSPADRATFVRALDLLDEELTVAGGPDPLL